MVGTSQVEVDKRIRELTDTEILDFREKGWTLVKGLLDPTLAAELFERGRHEMEKADLSGQFGIIPQLSEKDEQFRAVLFSKRMGWNGLRLMQAMLPTDVKSVRYWTDNIFLKMPKGSGKADTPTEYHQDFTIGRGLVEDRVSKVNFWIALNDLPPERSTLRFFSGSHRLGVLGPRTDPDGRSMEQVYPKLQEWCPLSPPLHLRPGDATIHHSLTVHGAPANTTDQPRYNYEFVYIHPDARYNGIVTDLNVGQARVELVPGRPFAKPIAYSE